MNYIIRTVLFVMILLAHLHVLSQHKKGFATKILYQSQSLVITQVSENAFEHTTYLQTNDFGKVPCNGLIVRSKNEAAIFDTPATDKDSDELIKWIKAKLQCHIKAVIPTHFHNDCLGGLNAFHKADIASYASYKTIELAKTNMFVVPQHGFKDSLELPLGNTTITAKFFGEGHTKDNVVGYFPAEKILFGGCLIKESNATRGFLGDANVAAWSNTVRTIKNAYPDARVIIPGHGAYGDTRLLDYTIKLFAEQ